MIQAHILGFPFPQSAAPAAEVMSLGTMQQQAGLELISLNGHAALQHLDAAFSLNATTLCSAVREARAQGLALKVELPGPLSLLWHSQAALDELDALLALYGDLLRQLHDAGAQWVQLDESILAEALPQDWKNAFERAYNLIQREPCRKLLACYGAALDGNLGLACGLPLDGLHVDLVQAPQQYLAVLDRLPGYKVLSLGVLDATQARQREPGATLGLLRHAHERLGERLWIASAAPLPANAQATHALAVCQNLMQLADALQQPQASAA